MRVLPKILVSSNLDLLRATAVLCVLINHLLGALHVAEIGSLGRFGVVLFFIHTSFVLMTSLERLNTTTSNPTAVVQAFWLRRIFRIYPLSIFVVAAIILFHLPPDPDLTYSWIGFKGLIANLLLVQNLTTEPNIISPLWSLPLEVQMYVLLPFLYFFVRHASQLRASLFCLASILAALLLPALNWRLNVFFYAPCFAAGILAYYIKRHPARLVLPGWVWPLGLLDAIAAFGPLDNVSLPHKGPSVWLLSIAVALLYAHVAEWPIARLQPITHWLAEHSYGIYLSHNLLLWLFLHRMAALPTWIRILLLALSLAGVPALLHRYIEQPLVLTGSHISRRILRPRLALLS